MIAHSFYVVYLLLFGTSLITFIESLRTPIPAIRHILNIETAVSLVAGMVYGLFVTMSQKPDFDIAAVTPIRYVDWAITTPMLLLVFLLFFNFYNRETLHAGDYGLVVLLNFVMLISGYLGETGRIPRTPACAIGFIAFAAMIGVIYTRFLHGAARRDLLAVFIAFVVIWSAYGVAFMLPVTEKNLAYNALDTISKVFLGLFMWVYYGKVLTV